MSRPPIALLALPAVAAVAAGCGSGKDEVSPAELVQKADAVCRTEQAKFNQIQAHPPANASIAADQTKELIDVSEAASSDLRELEPPDSLRDRFDTYLSARDHVVEEMKKGKDAADDRDGAGYAAAQTAVAEGAPERRRVAGAVGFRVCGSNPRSG